MQLNETTLQCFGLGRVRKDNTSRINSIDFHRTADMLVSASDDDSIHIYDTNKGDRVGTVHSQKYGANCVTCTHHPKTIIHGSSKGSNHAVRYLSLHNNTYIRYYHGHEDKVTSISMSPLNDMFMSASADRTVKLWDLRAGECQGQLRTSVTPCAVYDQQGLVMAIAGDQGLIKMYDAKKYSEGPFAVFTVKPEQATQASVSYMKFSNDGRRLLVVYETRVYVLDAYEGNLIARFATGTDDTLGATEASFTPCGNYILAGCQDRVVRVWEVDTQREVAAWHGHASIPTCVQFAPRRMLAASACIGLALWLPDSKKLGLGHGAAAGGTPAPAAPR